MEKSTIENKIAHYKRQRDELIKRANEQVIAYNGAIEALEDLLLDEVSITGNVDKEEVTDALEE